MENFSKEIIKTIIDDYGEDETLVRDMLFYLYETSIDNHLCLKICNWFNEHNYCLTCGSSLISYDYKEPNDSLEEPYKESVAYYCPICDKYL